MASADAGKGCIVQGVKDTEDAGISIYTGKDLIYKEISESEGSIVVNGDITGSTNPIAGKVMWGMGFYPPANATMLAVGGNLTTKTNATKPTYVGGNSRIGGTVDRLRITTRENLLADGYGSKPIWMNTYPYPDQRNARILQKLGRTEALKVDTDGDGTLDMDYNDYTSKTLIPLSDNLARLPVTGGITFSKAKDVPDYGWPVAVAIKDDPDDKRPSPYWKTTIHNEGLITFTGDNQQHRQVFDLDMNQVEAAASRLATNRKWSLDFRNIPDGQAIIINVTGKTDITWGTGWRTYVNGIDHSTSVNSKDASLGRFRSISSRIIWNYPTATNLRLGGTVSNSFAAWNQTTRQWDHGTDNKTIEQGALFPGSVLLPRGDLYDLSDTNGRLLVGGNLTMDIWEHHNAPWIGFDEPQCFAVSGRTNATLG